MAQANSGLHRWDLRLISPAQPEPLLAYGSQIGGGDREQHVEIPAQTQDCRVEISARHAAPHGWRDDEGSVLEDTPTRLEIGFSDPNAAQAQADDICLSLVFRHPTRAPDRRL